ncbi:MAG: DUF5050 domain-containing protein [Atopobiaceae bacterium]
MGNVTIGGTQMGNTPSNYAIGGYAVSDKDYDYFYSITRGGICRAKNDGSSTQVIVPGVSDGSRLYGNFSLDGGRLFYTENGYDDGTEIHSVGTDGSDNHVLASFSGGSGQENLSAMYLYDQKLYVLTNVSDGSASKLTYTVRTMDEDGSNQQKVGSFQTEGSPTVFLTKDKAFYTYSSSSNYGDTSTITPGKVYSVNLDGSNVTQVYQCAVGMPYSLVVQDDKVYVGESNYQTNQVALVQMDLDGSNSKVISTQGSYVEAIADGVVYVGVADESEDMRTIKISLSDGSASTLPSTSGYYYSQFYCAGDHLVEYEAGDGGYMGVSVCSVDYDGNKLHDYVVGTY